MGVNHTAQQGSSIVKLAVNMLSLRGFGSQQVGQGVLGALVQLLGPSELCVWLPRSWPLDGRRDAGLAAVPSDAGGLSKLKVENLEIRLALRRLRPSALLSLGDTSLPYPGVPHVLMVQQAFIAYPLDALDFPLPRRFRAKLQIMRAYFAAGLSSTSALIVQTEHMAQRLARTWRIDPARVHVVPTSINLAPQHLPTHRPLAARPTLVYISSPGPHKNHVVLASLMAALRGAHREAVCVVTAIPSELPSLVKLANDLGVLDRFRFVSALSHPQTLELLSRARVALMPSKLESFGMGYYEAMALGIPIVAADRPFAREACGAAALYADPDDGSAMASLVAQILDDATLSSQLSEIGRARFLASQRSWTEVAERYWEITKNAAGVS